MNAAYLGTAACGSAPARVSGWLRPGGEQRFIMRFLEEGWNRRAGGVARAPVLRAWFRRAIPTALGRSRSEVTSGFAAVHWGYGV